MTEVKKIKKLKNLTKDKDASKNPFAKLEAAKIGYVVLALAISMLLFAGLLIVQNALTEKIHYVDVVVATKEVPKGEIITKKNVSKYFDVVQIDQRSDVKGSFKKLKELVNKKIEIKLQKQEIVCDKDVIKVNQYIEKLGQPVQTAIACDNLANSNGGLIRTGDLINITVSINSISSEMLEMKNVYVSGVKDTSGANIANTDTSTVSSVILITIEETDAVELDKALQSNGQVRIAKVLYDVDYTKVADKKTETNIVSGSAIELNKEEIRDE